ncbi:thioredoxin domain-containing protein [Granulicella arctica]|uniref:thioredoxin domain-containing protein n=1 Tax=Granulicella arctica TaxID=940613 RepID=UPI0021DF6CBE|nr:thioredoxin domain-containing protein [Granulicella arctica]
MSNSHDTTNLNALSTAASAYLRSAMHQPVRWQEWGDAAFEQAIREDKPILLDIGAVWCHWCHVMDRESYENADIAEVINKFFVAVKVDRDERPDVDTRYQAAVSSISGQGGWPLTAFLTPDGLPFFGGTYFPPDDRHGRPGFRRVLFTMAEAFEKKRDEVNESAGSVMSAIEQNESFSGRAENPGPELVAKLVASALQQFDPRNGGFGSQPKFPHSGAVDLLLDVASRPGEIAETAQRAALVTLEKMSRGGIYDQLAGGFHRYSVDEHWVVPHFEKMAYDNSELLKNYVHAYQTFVEPESARVAREIVRWVDELLSDRERGGFYASQDADLSLDDDGDYFTWTLDEAAAVLTADELAIAGPFYNIREVGDMHHNPAKNVLHITQSLSAIPEAKNRPASYELETAKDLLISARKKLYAARLERKTPYIDKTVYTGWNAMLISAYLAAGRVFELRGATEFALKSLDRVLREAWSAQGELAHVVAYGEGTEPGTRVAGVLEDYVFLGNAALDAWEATGEIRYYDASAAIAESAVSRFYDPVGGAFFDTEAIADGELRRGALATRRKPLQDSPTPAGNSIGATLLLRLYALNGKATYADMATNTLESFAGVVEHFGLYAASYGLALQRMVTPPVQVCIIGEDHHARLLEAVALARFAVNKSVIRFSREQLAALPPALAETLPFLPEQERSFAVVCSGNTCQPPVTDVDALVAILSRAV